MNAIATRCVFIAEDEMCLAMMLEDILVDGGYRVLKAARLPAALDMVSAEHIDAAILDVNLAGKEVFPVADELQRRGVPLMFTSGYGENGLPEGYRGWPMLQKPYIPDQLLAALERMLVTA